MNIEQIQVKINNEKLIQIISKKYNSTFTELISCLNQDYDSNLTAFTLFKLDTSKTFKPAFNMIKNKKYNNSETYTYALYVGKELNKPWFYLLFLNNNFDITGYISVAEYYNIKLSLKRRQLNFNGKFYATYRRIKLTNNIVESIINNENNN